MVEPQVDKRGFQHTVMFSRLSGLSSYVWNQTFFIDRIPDHELYVHSGKYHLALWIVYSIYKEMTVFKCLSEDFRPHVQ